jgi:hypothetical protein
MKTKMIALASLVAAGLVSAGAAPSTSKSVETITVHVGVPGTVYIGQPLVDFIARFPGAEKTPFANQNDVVRLQVPAEGISALAMGRTPAVMTIESIGFNFEGTYEGVGPGPRRTAEGIGRGSTVNDLLGTYGKPAETVPEKRRGTLSPGAQGAAAAGEPLRYLYRSEDGAVATYFVVDDTRVVRMAMSRLAAVQEHLMKRDAAAPEGTTRKPAAPAPPSGHP